MLFHKKWCAYTFKQDLYFSIEIIVVPETGNRLILLKVTY